MWDVGVNLGGWLSQYGKGGEGHFESFVTEKDFEAIARAGFDHVRLPVDYPVIEEELPGGFAPREAGFERADRASKWAQACGLGLVFDLHSAPGFRFQDFETARLFSEPAMQERFIALWTGVAKRYRDAGPGLMLELMNEIVMRDIGPWNDLAARTIRAIRSVDAERDILVGGNRYNAPDALAELALFDDPHVVYSFHFYEPHLFTHQRAPWIKAYEKFIEPLSYPGTAAPIEETFRKEGATVFGGMDLSSYAGERFDLAYLKARLAPALAFREKTGKRLYCGEYGTFQAVAMESRRRWARDISSLLAEAGIGRAYWSWKEMGFGLVDRKGDIVDQGLLDAVLLI
jgi:endoglucanase